MFQAIGNNDHATLRVLAKTFVGAGNDLLALLCLDHVFSSPLKLQNLQLFEVQASLSLYLDYVRLLDKFLRDESVSNGSNNQRLFGFQVLGSGCWLVPKNTLLHGKLSSRLGSGDQSADGYRCRFDELRRFVTETISSRIHDRTKSQNRACYEVQGFSPCLEQLVQDECCSQYGRRPCTFQHIQRTQLTVDWYHAQLRLILLQFNILDTAGYCNSDVVKYVYYGTLYEKFVSMLMDCKATGLGYCTQHCIHLCRCSDPLRTLTFPAYPRGTTVSGLCNDGPETPVLTLTMSPRNLWTAPGSA